MKKGFLLLCWCIMALAVRSQTTSFSKDAKMLEERMKDWTLKKGYKLVVKYDLQNNASFYAVPNQDYAVFYIYDIHPDLEPNFKVYLMTPTDSLKQKYSAQPSEVAASGTAGAHVATFATNKQMLGGAAKLPVKLEASPKAKMYIYKKTRKV